MKKIKSILVLAFMLFATQSASAQFSLGILGGFNSSKFKFDSDQDQPIAVPLPTGGSVQGGFNSRTSFAIGGLAEYSFSPMVSLSVQPTFSQQGSDFVYEGPVAVPLNADTTFKLRYFDIPVMLKLQFGNAKVRPYVTSGFTLGFLTSAKADNGGETTDIKHRFKNTNWSWSIGGGLNLPVAGKTVFIEGRYALGLTNIDEGLQVQPLSPLSVVTDLKTKGFEFRAGFTFPLGGAQ